MKKLLLVLPLILLIGCYPDRVTRDVLASSQPLIKRAQAKYHDTCVANPKQVACESINKGIALQNTTIDALEVYCAGPKFDTGGECERNPQYESVLKDATKNLNQYLPDVKGLVK